MIELVKVSGTLEFDTPSKAINIDKTLTKADEAAEAKAVGEAIKNLPKPEPQKQADWAQMDETAPDFVKNRIGYVEDMGEKFTRYTIPKEQFVKMDDGYGGFMLKAFIPDIDVLIQDGISNYRALIHFEDSTREGISTGRGFYISDKTDSYEIDYSGDTMYIQLTNYDFDMDMYQCLDEKGLCMFIAPQDTAYEPKLDTITDVIIYGVGRGDYIVDTFKGKKIPPYLVEGVGKLEPTGNQPINSKAVKPLQDDITELKANINKNPMEWTELVNKTFSEDTQVDYALKFNTNKDGHRFSCREIVVIMEIADDFTTNKNVSFLFSCNDSYAQNLFFTGMKITNKNTIEAHLHFEDSGIKGGFAYVEGKLWHKYSGETMAEKRQGYGITDERPPFLTSVNIRIELDGDYRIKYTWKKGSKIKIYGR